MKFTQRLVVSALFLVFLETSFQIPPVLATLQFHRLKHAKLRSIFSDNQFLYNFFNQLLVDDGRSVFGGVTPIPVNESRKSNFRNVSKSPESSPL
ncbi:hypothetical protein SK128_019142 [Halocaridina rubra]|uniref:Uncharacterized protein n=1 Tax=Halocaridina rubra TaxID=373956 RepID=A0AAN8XMA3_HALRR